MRFCISIVKIKAFHFLKQKQRFFLKPLINSCLRPAEYKSGLIRRHFCQKKSGFQPTFLGILPKFSCENLMFFHNVILNYFSLMNLSRDFDCFRNWLCIIIFNWIFKNLWDFDQKLRDFDIFFTSTPQYQRIRTIYGILASESRFWASGSRFWTSGSQWWASGSQF